MKNIRLCRPSKKLEYCFLGPFEIMEAIGKQAYCLDLLKTLEAIHPVFHVSFLELYHRRAGDVLATSPLAILMDDGEEYEVDTVLNEHQRNGRMQYLVKWTGYPNWKMSWEDESNLGNVEKLLEAFKAQYPTAMSQAPCRGPQHKRCKR